MIPGGGRPKPWRSLPAASSARCAAVDRGAKPERPRPSVACTSMLSFSSAPPRVGSGGGGCGCRRRQRAMDSVPAALRAHCWCSCGSRCELRVRPWWRQARRWNSARLASLAPAGRDAGRGLVRRGLAVEGLPSPLADHARAPPHAATGGSGYHQASNASAGRIQLSPAPSTRVEQRRVEESVEEFHASSMLWSQRNNFAVSSLPSKETRKKYATLRIKLSSTRKAVY